MVEERLPRPLSEKAKAPSERKAQVFFRVAAAFSGHAGTVVAARSTGTRPPPPLPGAAYPHPRGGVPSVPQEQSHA